MIRLDVNARSDGVNSTKRKYLGDGEPPSGGGREGLFFLRSPGDGRGE